MTCELKDLCAINVFVLDNLFKIFVEPTALEDRDSASSEEKCRSSCNLGAER